MNVNTGHSLVVRAPLIKKKKSKCMSGLGVIIYQHPYQPPTDVFRSRCASGMDKFPLYNFENMKMS